MSDLTLPTPMAGDVFFMSPRSLVDGVSCWIQRRIDPTAARAKKSFYHVAIAVDRSVAIEAVPEPIGSQVIGSSNGLKSDEGEWTKIPLDHGVRPVVLPDLYYRLLADRSNLVVLRSPEWPADAARMTAAVAPLFGQEYSMKPLADSFEAYLSQHAPNFPIGTWMTRYPDLKARNSPTFWSSLPSIMTDEELAKIREMLPSLDIPQRPRSFFCSRLVADLVNKVLSPHPELSEPLLSPTGLYPSLTGLGWYDVTESDYSAAAIEQVLKSDVNKETYRASYYHALHTFMRGRKDYEDGLELHILKEAIERFNESLHSQLRDRLARLGDIAEHDKRGMGNSPNDSANAKDTSSGDYEKS